MSQLAPDRDHAAVYDHQLMRRLWRFIAPHRRLLFGSILLLPLTAALRLAPPYLIKLVIDHAIVPQRPWRLPPLAALLIGAFVVQQLASLGHTWLLQLCGQRAMHDLRVEAHRHLLSLRIAFFDRTPIGRLMARVTNDIESIAEAFASGLVAVVGDAMTLVGIVVAMLWLHWKLALLTFAVLPLMLLLVGGFQRLLRSNYRLIRKRLAQINATLQELINGMRVVQIFGREAAAERQFEQANREYRDAYKLAIRYDAMLFALVELLGSITIALLLWYGGIKVLDAAISFGLLVAFIEYVQRFFEPIRDISTKYATMQQAMAAAERVFSLLDTDELDGAGTCSDPATRTTVPAEASVPVVAFRAVSFRYTSDTPLFEQLSFSVPAGTSVAIVGSTGAGKSTIARLLTRLYEPQQGAIDLGGVNIKTIQVAELRRRIVVLSQDVFLFSGTVRDNIDLHDPSISAEAVERASVRLGLPRLMSLDRAVADRGADLSSGERQLIVFARALVRDPEVLLLDEATASVDPETERIVQEGVAELMRGRTAIVIAHRLATIERVDRVLVLHRGRIVEQGSHAELIAAGAFYKRLYQLQYVSAPVSYGEQR